MIRFRSPQIAQAAAEIGLTEQSLTSCIQHPDLSVCKKRLEDLKTDLKKAYRAAALRLHPDRTGNDPEKTELFKVVTRLWEEIQRLEIGPKPRPRPQPVHHPGVVIVVSGSGGWTSSSTTTNSTTTAWGGWKTWY